MVKKLVDTMIEREGERQGWRDRKSRKTLSLSLSERERREKEKREGGERADTDTRKESVGFQHTSKYDSCHFTIFFVLAQVSTFKTFFLFIL